MPIQTRTDDPNVRVTTYDTAILRAIFPEWPALDSPEKLQLLRANHRDTRVLGRRDRTANVTTTALHSYLAAAMDAEQSTVRHADRLAVGTAGDLGTAETDTDLNNRAGATDVTDTVFSVAASELQVTTFVDSTQFNGLTIDEIGILADNGDLWNHATLETPVEKANVNAFVVDVYFTIRTPTT